MSDWERFKSERTDRRAAIAREVVQQVANLTIPPPDEEDLLEVRGQELEAIVRRVLAQFGVRD